MTTYLITAAQRQTLLDTYKYDGVDKWEGNIDMLQSLPTVDSQPVDANMPYTERCIQNLVVALVVSKGWMHSYADAIIRDAIDRVHLTVTAITADDVTPAMHQEWNKIFRADDMSIACPKDGAIMAAAYNAVIKNRREAK